MVSQIDDISLMFVGGSVVAQFEQRNEEHYLCLELVKNAVRSL